jgi:uncharacterized membrane protein SpoIIM required for sporulation
LDFREFTRRRRPAWERFDELMRRAGRSGLRGLSAAEVGELGRLHRRVNADYAYANTFFAGTRVAGYLGGLVARAHGLLYRVRRRRVREALTLVGAAPAVLRRNRGVFWLAAGLFAGWCLLGYGLGLRDPSVAAAFLPEEAREGVQQGRLWTEGLLNVFPGSLLSVRLFSNNFSVAVMAFATGVTVLGPVYVLSLNGLMLGAIFAYCEPYGLSGDLFGFILAHGPLELSAIVLSGTAGLMLARGLLSPGLRTRAASLKAAGREAVALFPVIAGALVVAAVLEGMVSTNEAVPLWLRGAAGLAPAWLMYYWLFRVGRQAAGVK